MKSFLCLAPAFHVAREHIQRREQRCCSVPVVIRAVRRRGICPPSSSSGTVRSGICIRDFSSTHITMALSGGYKPATSVSFPLKWLPALKRNSFVKCGLMSRSRRIVCTVLLPVRKRFAGFRRLRCVAFSGFSLRQTIAFLPPRLQAAFPDCAFCHATALPARICCTGL